jgi:hypothetical protein
MPRNGSGTYSLPAGNPVVTGTTISSTWANNTLSDIATALTNSVSKDGQTAPVANMPMGGFKMTGLGTGTDRTDSANLGQIQDQGYIYLSSVSGSDTITANTSPATTAYIAGQAYRFVASGDNTGAATINLNGLGAKGVAKGAAEPLQAGDLRSGAGYTIVYDGTQFLLLNPSLSAIQSVSSAALQDSALGFSLINGTLTASVASNALTIAIKTKAGTDPSASDPVLCVFRNATLATGDYVVRSITAATSLVISSGSTLGTTNAVQSTLTVMVIDNAGTVELAVANNLGTMALTERDLISTTSEGGVGGADSTGVAYSATARSNVPYRVIGSITSTQATAGAWATSPSSIAPKSSGLPAADDLKPALNASGIAPIYACRAWVNFNGTGTVAIRASGNVSSITDNGQGDYTINFTTAMPDANYAPLFFTVSESVGVSLNVNTNYSATASSIRARFTAWNGTSGNSSVNQDMEVVSFAAFR